MNAAVHVTKDLVLINLEARDKAEVVLSLARLLERRGYVKPSFGPAVLSREERFPTGLPTTPVGVAIPHADAVHCLSASMAAATLARPVKFGLMGDDCKCVDVGVVFLLALTDAGRQAEFLARLTGMFSDPQRLLQIKGAREPGDLIGIIQPYVCGWQGGAREGAV
ncbi:MAG: PTS sugar transporter subunit IIA [Firmicutes bacterium]|nr:PTS sugar transporter subunit IIA [Bacillota bacterium]